MWADNETDIDLLGFEYLVDELEILLTEQRLLPVTVGVAGDWGSGKTSLMQMARARLEGAQSRDEFICVSFSPWRFEDYRDIKAALMTAVVDELAERIESDEGLKEKAGGLLKKVRSRVRDWHLLRHTAQIGAAAVGGGPEEIAGAGAAADVMADMGAGDEDVEEYTRSFETVAHFHEEFASLMASLGDDIQALVVFIDDMDRCSTATIIQTFEAIRLFLHAPKTAYVVGAHADIVEAALEGRYPARHEGDEHVGLHYLEKMLQNGITIPPLAEPEAQTYINLLFAELYTEPEQFDELREAARKNREQNQLAVAMNAGIAEEAIGALPAGLGDALDIAERIGPPLVRGLRGNPRQLKRFLNRLLLRQRTAAKRSMLLDPDKLAKLMVLEELHRDDFEQLFHWQLEADGVPAQLRVGEALARGETVKPVPDDVRTWLMQPGIRDWLQLDPPLADVPLGPYYTFSRDRLKRPVQGARLPVELQQLLIGLQSDAGLTRTKAVGAVQKLEPTQLSELVPALLDVATGDLNGPAAKSLVEVAKSNGDVATAMFTALGKLPARKATGNFVLLLGLTFRGTAPLDPLLDRWEESGTAAVKKQVDRLRKR